MNKRAFLIGISGRSGSGKTFLIDQLQKHFGEHNITVISQDNYYKSIEFQKKDEQGIVNFDLPEGVDAHQLTADIHSLLSGQSLKRKEYTFNNPNALPKVIDLRPTPIVAVEGIFIYHYERVRELLDFKLFIDCPAELALQRRIDRDNSNRGYDRDAVLYQWEHHVEQAYHQYLAPYKKIADRILESGADPSFLFRLLEEHLRK